METSSRLRTYQDPETVRIPSETRMVGGLAFLIRCVDISFFREQRLARVFFSAFSFLVFYTIARAVLCPSTRLSNDRVELLCSRR